MPPQWKLSNSSEELQLLKLINMVCELVTILKTSQCDFSSVIAIELVKLEANIVDMLILNMTHLFQFVDNILCLAAISHIHGDHEAC
jgi:hypothetical protein